MIKRTGYTRHTGNARKPLVKQMNYINKAIYKL